MATPPKTCPLCTHSRAAHTDGVCALCKCISRPRTFVQESLAFRSALPGATAGNTRKR